jgi:hypothetical protein
MCADAARSGFEIVHFVEGFNDGVLNGTADYDGTPHHFELRSAEPDLPEVYRLTPLSAELFSAVTEAWEIWRRFEREQRASPSASANVLPALPEDRERQAVLRGFISKWLLAAQPTAFLAEADFEQDPAGLRVKWSRIQA